MIEDMRLEDVEEVLAIERVSFPTPWSAAHFQQAIAGAPPAVNRVLREGGALVGYACGYAVADEVQVHDIAVAPEHRGRGLGGRLLDDLLAIGRARGATLATLEVRPSNTPARRLYAARGFSEVGRRAGYYAEGGEDALLLSCRLEGAER